MNISVYEVLMLERDVHVHLSRALTDNLFPPGHIYAGGALLGLCHDYLIMNNKKGFFCLPEVKQISHTRHTSPAPPCSVSCCMVFV